MVSLVGYGALNCISRDKVSSEEQKIFVSKVLSGNINSVYDVQSFPVPQHLGKNIRRRGEDIQDIRQYVQTDQWPLSCSNRRTAEKGQPLSSCASADSQWIQQSYEPFMLFAGSERLLKLKSAKCVSQSQGCVH